VQASPVEIRVRDQIRDARQRLDEIHEAARLERVEQRPGVGAQRIQARDGQLVLVVVVIGVPALAGLVELRAHVLRGLRRQEILDHHVREGLCRAELGPETLRQRLQAVEVEGVGGGRPRGFR